VTTLPPESPRPSTTGLHQHRHVAESFGTDAARYDRARPHYPEALVNRILAGSPGLDVLDVGCGTGIEARQFQAAGATVLGVEPDGRMAEFARRRGLEVEVAAFEAWEPAHRVFDAVVAGQSWHWVDPVFGATKAARVLRPGGRLSMFGHVFEPPPAVAEAFTAVCRRVAPDSPFNARPMRNDQPARRALDMYQAMFTRFGSPGSPTGSGRPVSSTSRSSGDSTGSRPTPRLGAGLHLDWEQAYTREEWLDLLPTTGGLTQLPTDELDQVLEAVGAAIDAMGGSFTMPHVTLAVTATRTSAR
jgi:SAM-dependent methyltransferase